MSTEVRIVCQGGGAYRPHTPAELARMLWTPTALNADGVAVWDGSAPLRGMELTPAGDGSRAAGQPGTPRRVRRRAPVRVERRADGGATFFMPGCVQCGRPETPLRDDTLRAYTERVRGTLLEGRLDVASVPML